jgi:cytidylate kinase
MIITIDGPSASGKSSAAQALAQKLGWYYLNTGLLYRAVTYCLLKVCGRSKEELRAVSEGDLARCANFEYLCYAYTPDQGPRVTYDGVAITGYLKDAEIDECVSYISPQPHVRHALSQLQRDLAQTHDVVCDGRDVGSVVFPDANFKFYLTADATVRATRWQKDQRARGHMFTLEQAQQRVQERDTADSARTHSPLVVPDGGIIIDSSDLTLEQTVVALLAHIKQ